MVSIRRAHGLPRLPRRAFLRQALGAVAAGAVGAACQPPAGQPAAPASQAPAGAPTSGAASVALAQRRPFKLVWTAVTGSQAALWMAYETGAWRELGLDVELIRIPSSSRLAASMQAGEVDGGSLDWAVAFQFVAQGGNTREVGGITNRQIFAVLGTQGVTRPQDVVGKRWGITRLGSSTHTASLLALEQWRIRPEEVNFLQLQEVPAILAAMQAGQVDVGTMSPPTSTRALQAGFRELIDLSTEGPEYPSIGLGIVERHIAESPDLVRAYIAGYAMGVVRFRRDREQAIALMRKYLEIEDQAILEDTHARASRYLAFPPLVPMDSLPRVKQDVVEQDPQVAGVAITDVAVPRFAEELEAQGYFASLA